MGYNYKKAGENAQKHLLEQAAIPQDARDKLAKFLEGYEVSAARLQIFCQNIERCFIINPDIHKQFNDKQALKTLFVKMGKQYSPATVSTSKAVLKTFLRWLNDGDVPKSFKEIKIESKSFKRDLKTSDMVTLDDAQKMLLGTTDPQLIAMLMVQLYCGFRPSEFIGIKYGDVHRLKNGYSIQVTGKTGQRDVLMIAGAHHLTAWIAQHPTKKDDDPLWVRNAFGNFTKDRWGHAIKQRDTKPNPPTAEAIVKRFRNLAKRIGIKKPMDLYNLRHSCAVILSTLNFGDDWAADNFGHSIMIHKSTYGRLTTRDREERAYRIAGLEADVTPIERSVKCAQCGDMNNPQNDACIKCGHPLSIAAALKQNKRTAELIKQEVVASVLAELKKGKK